MLHSLDKVSVVVLQAYMCLHAVRLNFKDLYHYGWFPQHRLCQLCLYEWDGGMDGWMDGKKREWGDSWLDGLTTHLLSVSISLSLFPTFCLGISSPPTCSHIEWGINPSHFYYLSLSVSTALSATSFWPFSTNRIYTCCGHKWACVSPVPQQSYHVLIRYILVAHLGLLIHPFPPIIGQKPLPTCQQEPQYKCCNLFLLPQGLLAVCRFSQWPQSNHGSFLSTFSFSKWVCPGESVLFKPPPPPLLPYG